MRTHFVLLRALIISIFFFALSWVSLYPYLSASPAFVPDKWDGLLAGYTIRSVQDNLLALRSPFAGGIFYPHQNTLAFSDTFVSSALLTLPLRLFTHDPVIQLQVNLLLALWMTSLATFLFFLAVLHERSSKATLLALTFTILFSWSQAHFHYLAHLHVFGLQFAIVALASHLFFLRTQNRKWLIGLVVGMVLQAWQSIFPVYVVMLVVGGTLWFPNYRDVYKRHWKHLLIALISFILLTIPVVRVYAEFYQTYHSTRDIREVIHFSMIPADIVGKFASPVAYLAIAVAFLSYLKKRLESPGSRILLRIKLRKDKVWLLVAAFTGMTKRMSGNDSSRVTKMESRSKISVFLTGTTIFLFILCFGPALHIGTDTVKFSLSGRTLHVPLPYTLFYYLVPGFKAFRTPSRFFPFVLLFALGWSARQLIDRKISSRKIWTIAVVTVLVTFALLPTSPSYEVPQVTAYPTYVSWLKRREERVVLYLPMYDWVEIGNDHLRMLYTLEAGKQEINGQSGFYPPDTIELLQLAKTGKTGKLLERARELGAELVIVDKGKFREELPIQQMFEDESVKIYSL